MVTAKDEHTGMIQVELSDDQISQRSAKLASEELDRAKLLEKKRTHNRKWNEELKQYTTSISVLAAEVDTHQAWVPAQAGMFDEDGVAAEDEAPQKRRRGRRAQAENDGAAA
jgi:soluble cytochrome b562